MSADSIAYDLAAKQGWSETTLLDLVLTYVERQASNDAFEEYLNGIAAEENTGSEDDFLDRHDALHDAADEYASSVADQGKEYQVAFLSRSGQARTGIDTLLDANDAEALDEKVRDICHSIAADAVNEGRSVDWLKFELDRNHFIERIEAVVERKQDGTESTAEESTEVKAYLRPRISLVTYDANGVCTLTPGLLRSVVENFPLEWDEVFDEAPGERDAGLAANPIADLTPEETDGAQGSPQN